MDAAEITRLLDELGGRLEGPARYVFDLTVRQVVLEGFVAVTVLIVGLVLVSVAGVTARNGPVEDATGDLTLRGLIAVVLGLISIFFLFGGAITTLDGGLLKIANPEYAALERLIDLIP